jgi:hypothetical protein
MSSGKLAKGIAAGTLKYLVPRFNVQCVWKVDETK